MHSPVPEHFTRDLGCTEAEWLLWLPGAAQQLPMTLLPGHAQVTLGVGTLDLRWHELPPRRIALLSIPRLGVSFTFEGVDEAARSAFMRRFDLHTHRGGG